jgi:hypothetical protein
MLQSIADRVQEILGFELKWQPVRLHVGAREAHSASLYARLRLLIAISVPSMPLCDGFLELDNEVLPGRLTEAGLRRAHVARGRTESPQLIIGHSA